MVMAIALMIMAGLFLAGLITILVTRTTLSVSFRNTRLKITMAMIGCGLRFDSRENQLALFCGRWSRNLKPRKSASPKKTSKKISRLAEPKPRRKSRRRLPFSTIVKLVKAGLLCFARVLARVQYDEAKLELRPVIANPALAGMAFGWGQAFGGIFPRLRESLEFNPSCGTGTGSFSGKAVFSIKNRQVVYVMWRLLRDLPIIELIKYRFFKKR